MVQLGEDGSQNMISGSLPEKGTVLGNFTFNKADLSEGSLEDYRGQNVILNIFLSIDTGVCGASTRKFNEQASQLENTTILCVSKDLPFALSRFCGAEGIDRVETVTTFRNSELEDQLGNLFGPGKMEGLYARTIVVLNPQGEVLHTQLTAKLGEEPDYESAIAAL